MALSNFTRATVTGKTATKGKTSDGTTVDSNLTLGPIGLEPSVANKKTYPGAFSINTLGLDDNLRFTDITGNIDTTIINNTWFRDKYSETS